MQQRGIPLKVKRLFDITVASGLLLAAAPALGAVAAAVRLKLGSPVFFRQTRPGRDGVLFQLYKLRTMTDERDAEGNLLPDALRLTPFGQRLRNLSLDELPQLWNVIRGDMSLVGPRPLLVQYLERYTPEQARRHDVLPGITGWCQVNGRNSLSWEEKFGLDVWYVDNWSPWLDVSILLATVSTLFKRTGISHSQYATMPEFLGYDGRAEPAPEYRTISNGAALR